LHFPDILSTIILRWIGISIQYIFKIFKTIKTLI
jgi:hypothetical protein